MKKVIGSLLIFIGLVLAFAVFLPSKKHCEKSVVVNKPVAVVFNALNNIENWQNWLPVLLKNDSTITVSYEDKPNGKHVMVFEGEHFKGHLCIRKEKENKCLKLFMPVQHLEEGEEEENEHHHHMQKAVFRVMLEDMGDSTVIHCMFDMDIPFPMGRLMMPFKDLYISDLMTKSETKMAEFMNALELPVAKDTVVANNNPMTDTAIVDTVAVVEAMDTTAVTTAK